MPAPARWIPVGSVIAPMGLAFSTDACTATGTGQPGTTPQPTAKLYQCAGQLKRAPDQIITMEASKAFYKVTDSAAPVTTDPVMDPGYPVTAAAAKAKQCKRRMVEIRVPSSTSSGCANCYPNAEIHACAGQFSGSKSFEEHCRVPATSTAEATCKTFNHAVEVYKKKSGEAEFSKTPIATYVYKGFVDDASADPTSVRYFASACKPSAGHTRDDRRASRRRCP